MDPRNSGVEFSETRAMSMDPRMLDCWVSDKLHGEHGVTKSQRICMENGIAAFRIGAMLRS